MKMFEGFSKVQKNSRNNTGAWATEPCIAVTRVGFSFNKLAIEQLKIAKKVVVHHKDNLIGFTAGQNGEGFSLATNENGHAQTVTMKALAGRLAKYAGNTYKLSIIKDEEGIGGLIDLNKVVAKKS